MSRKGIAATLMAALFMTNTCRADAIQLTAVDVDFKRFIGAGQDANIYPREHKDMLNLSVNFDLWKVIYFNNKVVSVTDSSQFRMVGLHMNMGVHLGPYWDVEYFHRSEHVLDAAGARPGYPLYDAVGVVFHVIPRKD